ncbi:MAG: RHS repeat-associated core domain-containing protein [Bacteroidales bacterium]|nr:RHS repeat-associated core domain-containing protein [Bacteroidales bacterium]
MNATNGTEKTGIGSYSYDSDRPHAVDWVDNTGGLVSEVPQYVTYTPFNKVATVNQGTYNLTITYGPDRQRCKTALSRNDTLLYTRYYADNYEEVHAGDTVYRYYYVYTSDGLSMVAERIGNTMNLKLYSVETDYLGSIVAMYNYKGQTEFRAEYDAWGRQNVVTNNLAHFQRGYCGHEHWHEFDLIDMNGRMYDPVISRFLSPDPFVQAPEDLQNYNRYSYCLNNPLKYTDPSGELAWEAIVIGAIVGGITNVCVASKTSDSGGGAYFLAGAAVGAVSGLCGGATNVAGIISGCATGAALGAASGVATSASTTILNNCISGTNWNTGLTDALWYGLAEGAITGALGGCVAGLKNAKKADCSIWTGRTIYEKTLVETDVTSIIQKGPYDCGFAAVESTTGISQESLSNYYSCGPHGLVPMDDLAETLDAVSNSTWSLNKIKVKSEYLANALKNTDKKVLLTTIVYDEFGKSYGHGLALKNVIQRNIISCTGRQLHPRYYYTIMDPVDGNFYRISSKRIQGQYLLTHLK